MIILLFPHENELKLFPGEIIIPATVKPPIKDTPKEDKPPNKGQAESTRKSPLKENKSTRTKWLVPKVSFLRDTKVPLYTVNQEIFIQDFYVFVILILVVVFVPEANVKMHFSSILGGGGG